MRVERLKNNAIIKPEGRIDIRNSQELKKKMLQIYDEGYKYVIIDFSEVESIDSSGLGKLLLFQKKLKERDGELKITKINNDYIKKMFKMIHLDKVINIEE
ncbi:STAS domain-containing protein [Caldisalinibacter kiritimatiensis]|uniref:Anti-sigma factor antagonist n=1 Tax=Caldisalinibacter kiritimatiensis TaxID=1304284 RepID=R1ARD0_9FIRM|nr:STAS domain-containing protein [Caldisalinibacter kiritimatiensis]EOC99256.1 anti-sigma-factor antagonist [Caldisalinibacter kiritimatiensis]